MTAQNPQPQPTDLARFHRVFEILEAHGRDSAKLIPILQAIQAEYRYLPIQVLSYVANSLQLPPAHVYGVATFYAHFALEPKGKYVIRVCDGTACHVRGSTMLLDTLREKLQLSEAKTTTDDGLFTVETVSCLGACGLAPVMVVNEDVYGQVSAERAGEILDELRRNETPTAEVAR